MEKNTSAEKTKTMNELVEELGDLEAMGKGGE